MSRKTTPPANLEAEEGLIACCILERAQEVVARCVEDKITPDSFFKPAHQVLFGAILSLHNEGVGIDEIILCEKLNTLNQLEAIGGHGEIYRIISRVETSAHYIHWLQIVKEKAALRRLISTASRIVEAAHAGQTADEIALKVDRLAEVAEAMAPGEKRAHTQTQRAQDKLCKLAESHLFDQNKRPPETPPILSLRGHHILNRGNFLALLAGKSSGKSSTIAAMLASLYGHPDADYLNFTGFNPHQMAVLHTDTEQSAEDHWNMLNRSMRRARVAEMPSWVKSVHLRRFAPRVRADMICALARKYHQEIGLCVVFIDGLVDLMRDFNDPGESTDLTNRLMELIEDTGCGIVTSLHVNPGQKRGENSEKGRGHIGTLTEQKAQNVILFKKDRKPDQTEIISIEVKDGRHGLGPGASCFTWSDEAKMHVTVPLCEGFTPLPSLADRKADQLAALARDIFDGWEGRMMPFSIVRDRAMQVGAMPTRTAERRINELMRAGLIIKSDSGHYGLNVQGPN